MMVMALTVFWYDIRGGIQIEDTFEWGVLPSNRGIFFAIRRLDLNLLYVVRWTNWTKKLDVKIRYIFLFISYFGLCLSFSSLIHWFFFS
jgi:hypothetical protein